MKKRLILFIPLIFGIIGAFFYFTSFENKREKYEKFLSSLSFSNISLKKGAKKDKPNPDRPDLSWFQNFVMTLDPNLGYPPTERLFKIYESVSKKTSVDSLTEQWSEIGPNNVGGRVRAIMFDPNDPSQKKVWAGGVTGGLWFNNDITNPNSSWQKVSDFWGNLAVTCIAFDPNNPQIFYVGTGEGWGVGQSIGGGIWKSTNAGQSWTYAKGGLRFAYVNDIVVRNEGGKSVVYAAVDMRVYEGIWHNQNDPKFGLYRSMNAASSFMQVLPTVSGEQTGKYYTASDIEIGADNRIYVGTKQMPNFPYTTNFGGGTILYSDAGTDNTWTVINSFDELHLLGANRVEIAVSPSDANIVYAVIEVNKEAGKMLKSYDRGNSWQEISKPADIDDDIPDEDFTRGQGWYDLILAVSPENPDIVIAGGIDLFLSVDGGNSWKQISKWSDNNRLGSLRCSKVHADQHAIVFRPNFPNEVVFGNDGGIAFSSEILNSQNNDVIKHHNQDFNVTQFYTCAIHPNANQNYFLAGAQDNGTQQFQNSNSSYDIIGGDGGFCFIDEQNPEIQIASYVYNHFYISKNNASYFSTLLDDDTGLFINPADYDSYRKVLYTSRDETSIYAVRNVTSSPISDYFTFENVGARPSSLRVCPFSNTLYFGTQSGGLFKVSDPNSVGYKNLTNLTGTNFPTGNISCIEFGNSESEIYVTFSNFGIESVWFSNDGGNLWLNKEGNLPDMPIRWILRNPRYSNEVILATEVGVWGTKNFNDGLPEWTALNNGLANVRVDMLRLRKSDFKVVAATFGRGLFVSDGFSKVGIEKNAKHNEINIFPNPNNGNFEVQCKNLKTDNFSMKIFDMRGKMLYIKQLKRNSVSENIPVSLQNFAKGQYILEIEYQNQKISKKFIVQ